ncbi:hypothetical protein HO133_007519 [Letharia lupina]|uniref:Uncharacterized protein n=1 Tax=Letharia lupina TaxID=560253 RepID=A0A8H6FIX2_9LECA|nr:uncharacterized protein HO133_007519 [Letharia lupina]KAF6229403.1 hypothetical protein HO133_007519 [Letharia lupina]
MQPFAAPSGKNSQREIVDRIHQASAGMPDTFNAQLASSLNVGIQQLSPVMLGMDYNVRWDGTQEDEKQCTPATVETRSREKAFPCTRVDSVESFRDHGARPPKVNTSTAFTIRSPETHPNEECDGTEMDTAPNPTNGTLQGAQQSIVELNPGDKGFGQK